MTHFPTGGADWLREQWGERWVDVEQQGSRVPASKGAGMTDYEIHGVDGEGEPLTGRTAWFPIDAFADHDPDDLETCSAPVHYPEGARRVLVPTAQYMWVLAYGDTEQDLVPMCEACMDRIAKQYGTTAALGAVRRK